MSLKVKLISCISLFMLMLGVLVIGVFAATQQQISMQGNLSFVVPDKSLYVKNVRYQEAGGEAVDIESFTPGYINGSFNMDLTALETEENAHGSFALYFDIINTTDIQWAIVDVELPTALTSAGVSASYSGIIPTNDLTDTDSDGYKNFDSNTPIDGTLILTITAPNSSSVNLEGIVITINEYIDAAVQVTSVSSSGATTDTYTDLAGGVAIDGSVDLSGIEFATGETTLTISMTSLNAKYIKNIVSYDSGVVNYNTTGTRGTLFVHSTSLYLPQNQSGELTSGESKYLTIYVNNNTSSATTISGLKVSFEEKESLLQKDTENKYWYVEMGTVMGETESEYIRWKYIASVDDSSGSDVATKYTTFDADTAPTGEGYFYLETNVLTAIGRDGTNDMIEVPFNNEYDHTGSGPWYHDQHGLDNVLANDYATSNVRQYINGNNAYDYYEYENEIYTPSGRYSNMYTDLNINTEDAVFGKIATRSLGELYQDNSGGSSSATSPTDVTFPDLSGADEGYRYQKTDKDAFWLLSYYEVYQLTGGSSITGSDSGRVWPTGSANTYLLRSPHSSRSSYAYRVSTSGYLSSDGVVGNFLDAARAAFKFSI